MPVEIRAGKHLRNDPGIHLCRGEEKDDMEIPHPDAVKNAKF